MDGENKPVERRRDMVTIKDVAATARVSVGTVSRVLSKNETVKQRLRERVNSAVQTLGYKPNLAARSLRTNKVNIIGFLVPDITNPFFAQLAKYAEMAAAQHGILVILANSHGDLETERRQLHALLDHNPRGVIIVAASDSGNQTIDTDVQMIALDRSFAGFPCISSDHEKSAGLAADHLLMLGHRRIGYISGPRDTAVARARKKGFLSHLKTWSAKTGEPYSVTVMSGSFDYASGESIGHQLLNCPLENRPTAIASGSDQQAIGVMRIARDLGIDIPSELSVVGFDDIDLADVVVPRLTTIQQPVEALASSAIHAILNPTDLIDTRNLVARLIKRGSSGPAPRK